MESVKWIGYVISEEFLHGVGVGDVPVYNSGRARYDYVSDSRRATRKHLREDLKLASIPTRSRMS